jgi:Ca-activated chloride channel family protein
LLEQHLPNVFQMNAANILPGDDVKVELRYTELLTPQGGNCQFVFPTGVGPRYNSPRSENAPSTAAGNRDFVLDDRLAGERIESGLMLHQGQGENAENFFLAMVEPPKSAPASAIVAALSMLAMLRRRARRHDARRLTA